MISVAFIILFASTINGKTIWLHILTGLAGFVSLSTIGSQISTIKEILFLDKNYFTKFSYPNYKEVLGEKEKIKTELEIFRDLILKSEKTKKLVILIDELDRCDRNRLERFFSAIETFIDMEKILFVFSFNPKTLFSERGEATILDSTYLEKYIKISFILPPNKDYQRFIEEKCKTWTSEIDNKLVGDLTMLVNTISNHIYLTPRQLNKALNLITIYRFDYKNLTLLEFSSLVILLSCYSKETREDFSKNMNDNASFEYKVKKRRVLIENSTLPSDILYTFIKINPNLNSKLVCEMIDQILEVINVNSISVS